MLQEVRQADWLHENGQKGSLVRTSSTIAINLCSVEHAFALHCIQTTDSQRFSNLLSIRSLNRPKTEEKIIAGATNRAEEWRGDHLRQSGQALRWKRVMLALAWLRLSLSIPWMLCLITSICGPGSEPVRTGICPPTEVGRK